MWHLPNGPFWGMHFMWWIFWMLVIIAIITGLRRKESGQKEKDTPLEILQKRFANGEISKEEYEEKKKVLENN